ncbi:MAG: glutamate--tRNA ligase [Thermodesulfobacteriota bacterium]
MKRDVVVRFAPSPTGYLHIGGARTAIFNWLYARKTGGKFILRIEDTDEERSSQASVQGILDGLRWLGLEWDEGPYLQSGNIDHHLAAARQLVESGYAYKCFCAPEELDRQRETARAGKTTYRYDGACRRLRSEEAADREAAGLPHTIRLKVPRTEGGVVFEDAVYGRIEKQYRDLEDFIIVRSNGRPLYVLSNSVDDIRDGVTHVIRGQDGLANTPKQILIYQALGAPLPVFVHMSLALDPGKAKISKRKHGEAVAIQYYREKGFLPWALVNFLVLLGWSPADNREIFSAPELIRAFSFAGISRNNPVIDLRQDDPRFIADPKAVSINAHYLRTLPVAEVAGYVRDQLITEGLWQPFFEGDGRKWFLDTVDLIRARFQLLTDFTTLGRAYFTDEFPVEPEALEKYVLSQDSLIGCLAELGRRMECLEPFVAETLEALIRDAAAEFGLKIGALVNAVRVAVTGQSVGPGFLECLMCIGRRRTAERLKGLSFSNRL